MAQPSFTGTYSLISMDAYIPFSMVAIDRGTDIVARRDDHSVHALGPLVPGVTMAAAAADIEVAARQLAQQYPDSNKDVTIRVFSEMLARPEEDGLREGGRGQGTVRHRLRNALVIAQVAVSLVLLVAAGLFVRSMGAAERADLGFRPDGVFNVHMDVGQLGYDEARGRAFCTSTFRLPSTTCRSASCTCGRRWRRRRSPLSSSVKFTPSNRTWRCSTAGR